jgi:hypothetical protein
MLKAFNITFAGRVSVTAHIAKTTSYTKIFAHRAESSQGTRMKWVSHHCCCTRRPCLTTTGPRLIR